MIQDRYVLIVDDDEAILETIREALEDEGYRAQTLRDGNTLLSHIHTDPPGMILLDLRMPRVDGRQLFARLQADPVASRVPVAIVTADDRGADQAQLLGAPAYLAKPFNIDALFACVARFMGPPVN
jgi:two-component system response regulator MprA